MKRGLWLALLLSGCFGPEAAPPWQVELIEGDRVKLQQLETLALKIFPRYSLPGGIREGDLLVGGEIDAARTAQARRAIHETRERAFSRAGAPVGRAPPSALTPARKR